MFFGYKEDKCDKRSCSFTKKYEINNKNVKKYTLKVLKKD